MIFSRFGGRGFLIVLQTYLFFPEYKFRAWVCGKGFETSHRPEGTPRSAKVQLDGVFLRAFSCLGFKL